MSETNIENQPGYLDFQVCAETDSKCIKLAMGLSFLAGALVMAIIWAWVGG